MKRLSLRGKIILPIGIILILLVLTMTIYSSVKFTNFSDILFNDRIILTANGLKNYLSNCEQNSKAAVVSQSANIDLIKAMKLRNKDAIIDVLNPTLELYNIDFYTITDETGIVLARTHAPERFGDSVLAQQTLRDALGGKVSTYYEQGTEIKICVRSGAPVYDMDGVLIGCILGGVQFETNEVVDKLKKNFGADFTVFFGDTRVATTFTKNEERIIGTKLDPEISKAIFGEKKEYFGETNIADKNFSVCYLPLINPQNEVFAILSQGISNMELIAEKNAFITRGVIWGLVGLVFSIIVLLIITKEVIKPIKRLTYLVTEVTHGNVDVDIDRTPIAEDEIGSHILEIYSLIDVIKSMVKDLSQLTKGLSIYSDIDFQIDTSKYKGSYKNIIDSIKALADSISMMHKTMAVMDLVDTMVCVTDFDSNLLYINRSLADAYGINRENYIGKKCYNAIRNLDHPCSICQLQNLMHDKDSLPSLDYEYVWDDALGKWVGGRSSIIRWVDGGMVFFNSMNDVTLKKMRQEQLHEAVETAEAASAAKSAFLANMSHELRTPLNVIVGLADIKLDDNTIHDETREILQNMRTAGSTLLSIVNGILDISKIESGRFVLAPAEYYLASLLNDTITLIITRIGEKPITFQLDINENLPERLYGDDLRVKQILINLLSNAIKYTDNGTVKLSVGCTRNNDSIWMGLTVRDTGIGIREEDIDKLFTDYLKLNTQATRKIEGTGLGLAISKRLSEVMDGDISVKSEYGKGSTFYVRIRQGYVNDNTIGPVTAENLRNFHYTDNKGILTDKLKRADLSGAKVLVVDDIKTNLAVAAGLMRKYKMHVDCVSSGQEAIDRIKREDPVYNAIFLDHMMPEMDGIETSYAIRALGTEYARTIPIIALTANAVAGTEELFLKHNFQAFLSKPIDVLKLDIVLKKWVQNSIMPEPASS